jgi:Zn-dependent M28 family amino/carboxypeptidase
VDLGPRPAGSEGSAKARALIGERLRQAGWPVREQRFTARPPEGAPVSMTNVIAELPGQAAGWIQLGTHYDTKRLEGVRFVGANDGASGVALLLELARHLGAVPRPYGVRMLFFDGEEAFGADLTQRDGLYGSRFFAEEQRRREELSAVRAMVVVDMVADADLDLVEDLRSSPRLRRLFLEGARALGLESVVTAGPRMPVVDDHVPFLEGGLTEILCLIDFRYGDRSVPGPLWHTSGDSLEAVSSESLNTVGRLVVELYDRLVREIGATSAPSG